MLKDIIPLRLISFVFSFLCQLVYLLLKQLRECRPLVEMTGLVFACSVCLPYLTNNSYN